MTYKRKYSYLKSYLIFYYEYVPHLKDRTTVKNHTEEKVKIITQQKLAR